MSALVMKPSDDRITVFAKNAAGGQDVAVLGALISSSGPEDDARVMSLAHAILDAVGTADMHARQLAQRDAEIERLRSIIERVAGERDSARAAIDASISGRRRFHGPVICKPHTPGDWNGAVWLLDPAKLESGFGLRFDSLADLHRAHPELWIVRVVGDSILLDAFAIATAVPS